MHRQVMTEFFTVMAISEYIENSANKSHLTTARFLCIIGGLRVRRTTVIIDDELINQALKVTKLKTKKKVIGESLKELIKKKNREIRQGKYPGYL